MADDGRKALAGRVAIVGAGPAGVAAAHRLLEVASGRVGITLVERSGESEYLPGTVPVVLGEATSGSFRQPVEILGVEVLTGEASRVTGSGVVVDGSFVEADYVIAAPGLETEDLSGPSGVHAFWSPSGAEAAAGVVRGAADTIAVVISSLPYRCPPAPYSLAMQLSSLLREAGGRGRVLLTTPEDEPLSALGGGVPEFLRESCERAGVDLHTGFSPDPAALGEGALRSRAGEELAAEVMLVVPPHRRPAALSGLAGEGPLVEVSPHFESSEEGLFVVGDAAAAPFPRAAGPAEAAGKTAADAVLARLGLGEAHRHTPAPECYVGHGGGVFSRISLSYPEGLPPEGTSRVSIEGPSPELARGPEATLERFRQLRSA